MDAADAEVEVEREGVVQPQLITADNTSAHQVALLAGRGELVVELPGLVHRTEVAAFLLTYIITYFGRHFPEGIPSVLVVPSPRCPRAVHQNAP